MGVKKKKDEWSLYHGSGSYLYLYLEMYEFFNEMDPDLKIKL